MKTTTCCCENVFHPFQNFLNFSRTNRERKETIFKYKIRLHLKTSEVFSGAAIVIAPACTRHAVLRTILVTDASPHNFDKTDVDFPAITETTICVFVKFCKISVI